MFVRFRKSRMTVVRALNAYGPRQSAAVPFGSSKVRKIMPSFICRALSGQDIEVYGDGDQIMDMIYVADVARILVRALEVTGERGATLMTVEAGTGRETTVNDIALAVIDRVSYYKGPPVELRHLPMRPGEDERSKVVGDPATLREIGIDPQSLKPLEDGVKETVSYFIDYLALR